MRESLSIEGHECVEVLCLVIPGIHTEQTGSRNQRWDIRVAEAVRKACHDIDTSQVATFQWYAVHLRWFVGPRRHRLDLDNFRLKPVLDSLTAVGLWPDDTVHHVRAICSEAHILRPGGTERLEVTVYGVL
jgi:Holliday junction resolvase RusA-like endonuclease